MATVLSARSTVFQRSVTTRTCLHLANIYAPSTHRLLPATSALNTGHIIAMSKTRVPLLFVSCKASSLIRLEVICVSLGNDDDGRARQKRRPKPQSQ